MRQDPKDGKGWGQDDKSLKWSRLVRYSCPPEEWCPPSNWNLTSHLNWVPETVFTTTFLGPYYGLLNSSRCNVDWTPMLQRVLWFFDCLVGLLIFPLGLYLYHCHRKCSQVKRHRRTFRHTYEFLYTCVSYLVYPGPTDGQEILTLLNSYVFHIWSRLNVQQTWN